MANWTDIPEAGFAAEGEDSTKKEELNDQEAIDKGKSRGEERSAKLTRRPAAKKTAKAAAQKANRGKPHAHRRHTGTAKKTRGKVEQVTIAHRPYKSSEHLSLWRLKMYYILKPFIDAVQNMSHIAIL